MDEINFDEEDVRQLRERVVQAVVRQPAETIGDLKPTAEDGARVQLNVRIRPDVKRRLIELARRRQVSQAEVIELGVTRLEQEVGQ